MSWPYNEPFGMFTFSKEPYTENFLNLKQGQFNKTLKV